jgi:hypothetical protein
MKTANQEPSMLLQPALAVRGWLTEAALSVWRYPKLRLRTVILETREGHRSPLPSPRGSRPVDHPRPRCRRSPPLAQGRHAPPPCSMTPKSMAHPWRKHPLRHEEDVPTEEGFMAQPLHEPLRHGTSMAHDAPPGSFHDQTASARREREGPP